MPDLALPRPRAVLFDLDGTLVDTVETRIEAWLEALAAAGFPTTRERLAPLIGVDGRRLAREIAALADTIGAALAEGGVRDAFLAQNETQAEALWKLRETLPEAEKADGMAAKHDIAAPGELVAITAGLDGQELGTNLFEVHRVPEL